MKYILNCLKIKQLTKIFDTLDKVYKNIIARKVRINVHKKDPFSLFISPTVQLTGGWHMPEVWWSFFPAYKR